MARNAGGVGGPKMAVELRQVRIFVTVAEELHFSRAATRLYLPQSVISEQVKRLERALGVVLFDRDRRKVHLSAAGAELLPLAQTLLLDAQVLLDTAARRAGGSPVVRLGIGRGMGRRLTSILRALAGNGLSVRPVNVTPAERTAMLTDGRLDAAIIRGRVRSTTLWKARVWDERLIAAVPDHHPLAHRKTVTLAELAATPVALVERDLNPALHDLLAGALTESGLAVNTGIPFTGIESTFAELATQPKPMWTPVFAGYEAEHPYEGIRTLPVEPALTLPAFLVAAPQLSARLRQQLLIACQTSA